MSENKQIYGIGTLTAEQAIKNAEEWTKSFTNPFADLDQFDAIQNPQETPREAEHEELKQRTIEWYLARWDKFTNSNTPDLMKSGRGKGEEWGETAKGVILQIAAYQAMTDEGREMYSIEQMYKDFPQTRWGNKYEPEARTEYAKATGYIVKECGFRVHPQIPYFGGSFDGEVVGYQAGELIGIKKTFDMDGNLTLASEFNHSMGVSGIIEIKCPADPIKHLKNRDLSLSGGITVKHEYYGQIQGNIEVAGVNWCDFVSYDPRCKDGYKLVIIRVMRDQIYIDAVINRVRDGKRILDAYMSGTGMDQAIAELNAEVETITKRELSNIKQDSNNGDIVSQHDGQRLQFGSQHDGKTIF